MSDLHHNRPPLVTADQLARDYAHLEVELHTLMMADVPTYCEGREDFETINAAIKLLTTFIGKVDSARETEKRPIIEAGNTIQAFFKHNLQGRAERFMGKIDAFGRVWLQQERRKAEAEARTKAEAAAAAAAEAKRVAAAAQAKLEAERDQANIVANIKARAEADAKLAEAEKTAKQAAAPVTSHVVTETGTASLVTEWTFEDVDLDKIDLEALRPFLKRASVEDALKAFVKSGRREIRGARIVEREKAKWR